MIKWKFGNSPSSLPPGSCLTVFVQEAKPNNDAILAETKVDNLKPEEGGFHYELRFRPLHNGQFVIKVLLNMGWCKGFREWIHNGDFYNDNEQPIAIHKGMKSVTRDITISQYHNSGYYVFINDSRIFMFSM